MSERESNMVRRLINLSVAALTFGTVGLAAAAVCIHVLDAGSLVTNVISNAAGLVAAVEAVLAVDRVNRKCVSK